MDEGSTLDRLTRRRKVAEDLLSSLSSAHGCPCGSDRFVFWAGKPQGPGWQDDIQNELVTAALRLPFFESSPPVSPEYWLESEVRCTICGALWKHYSEEWRMLAFQHRLVRVDGRDGDTARYAGLVGNDIAATAGFEPEHLRRLTLEEWAAFLLGEYQPRH